MISRKRIVFVTVLAVAVVVGVFTAAAIQDWPVHHFRVIEDEVLYAGAQPDAATVDRLVDGYHIKTIVNMRGHEPDSQWWKAERDACGRLGIRLVDFPLSERGKASEGIHEFLEIVSDPANHPVYVHCEAGSVRTGLAVAAYRMCMQGRTLEQAMAEAAEFDYHPTGRQDREYRRLLQRLADNADWRSLDDSPPSTETQPN